MAGYDTLILAEPSLQYYYYLGTGGIADQKDSNTATYQGSFTTTGNADSWGGTFATLFSQGYVTTSVNNGGITTYTEELWFKTSGATMLCTGNDGSVLFGNTDRGMYIGTNGLLYYNVFPGSNVQINGPTDLRDNQWHHAVATLNGNTDMRLYTDGQLVANTTSDAQGGYGVFWVIGAFKQGGRPNAPSVQTAQCYLSRAAFYNSALSAQQVFSHYQGGAPGVFSVRDPQATRIPGIN